jgi:GT2 family glycosyltransferase
MIFVGIVTCNRVNFFNKCYESVVSSKNVDVIAVCNDGSEEVTVNPSTIYIKHKKNKGVGASKNDLFKTALKNPKVEHIFIVEDDIIIKNPDVFNEYVKARNITGIQHFMFGYHGPANKNNISGGSPKPRYIFEYSKDFKLAINAHSVGAFCYYSRKSLEKTGIFDEDFVNAFDHVDHDYRLALNSFSTPYWNWADIANSLDYLQELECSETNSSIRNRKDWMENIQKGAKKFYNKHGFMPAWQNHVPDTSRDELIKILKKLKNENSVTITN